MKQELLKGKAGYISFSPYLDNQQAIASSATVTVKDNSGNVIVNAQAASIGSTGVISYQLSSANTADLGENYSAEWTYIIGGVTYYQTQLFDVVLNKLAITVVDDDLARAQADIFESSESFNGSVDSSGNTTLVDADLENYADNYWNGGKVRVLDSTTGAAQERVVTDFVQSSGTLTISNAWGTNPSANDSYIVRRGFKDKIELAFEHVLFEIRAKGFRPALIVESSELFLPLLKKSLALICVDNIKQENDKWDTLSKKYDGEYTDAMSKLVLQYDKDQDGLISGTEKNRDLGSLRMKR